MITMFSYQKTFLEGVNARNVDKNDIMLETRTRTVDNEHSIRKGTETAVIANLTLDNNDIKRRAIIIFPLPSLLLAAPARCFTPSIDVEDSSSLHNFFLLQL